MERRLLTERQRGNLNVNCCSQFCLSEKRVICTCTHCQCAHSAEDILSHTLTEDDFLTMWAIERRVIFIFVSKKKCAWRHAWRSIAGRMTPWTPLRLKITKMWLCWRLLKRMGVLFFVLPRFSVISPSFTVNALDLDQPKDDRKSPNQKQYCFIRSPILQYSSKIMPDDESLQWKKPDWVSSYNNITRPRFVLRILLMTKTTISQAWFLFPSPSFPRLSMDPSYDQRVKTSRLERI
jgi:hypothetical protein